LVHSHVRLGYHWGVGKTEKGPDSRAGLTVALLGQGKGVAPEVREMQESCALEVKERRSGGQRRSIPPIPGRMLLTRWL
jgi:hypothetical protein